VCPPKVGRFPTQESPLTVAFRSIVMTLAIAMFVVSRPVLAQPASSSLTHTVSLTVQPRVKVVVRNVATQPGAPVAGSVSASSAEGLALSVTATRPWMLLVGTAAENGAHSRQILVGQRNTASSAQAGAFKVASESGISSVVDASISINGADTAASNRGSQNDGAFALTIVAP
jgi:hypothetical protein